MDTHLVIPHLLCPIPKVWQPYALATAIVKYFSTSFPATASLKNRIMRCSTSFLVAVKHFCLKTAAEITINMHNRAEAKI